MIKGKEKQDRGIYKTQVAVRDIILLQLVIMIYTFADVAAKYAAGCELLSFGFVGFYALEILILGVYALLWQQVIKKFQLSIAYANRSIALLWSMLWAVIFFHEAITFKNIIGVAVVIIGTIIVNADE